MIPRKMVWRSLKKLGIKPPYDPVIPLLGIYHEEIKIERDTCIPLFIAALFTIARTWKQPRCPLTDEWIKKFLVHILLKPSLKDFEHNHQIRSDQSLSHVQLFLTP